MAGKGAAAGQAGPPTKKRKTPCQPCLLCPAGSKKRSYYGVWHEDTKLLELKFCSEHYKQQKAAGEDVSQLITRVKAQELRNGKPRGACVYEDCRISANYGVWDNKTKSHSLTLCSGHFNEFQAQGWDMTNVITRSKAVERKHGKSHGSCQHEDCMTTAYYGEWDEETKRFSAKLCASHYKMAVSGSEGASESLEAVEQYIDFRSARFLKTGREVGQCCKEDCTLSATFGSPCKVFTATHCERHHDPATMVSRTDNLWLYDPKKAAAHADSKLQYARQRRLCPGTPDGAACTHGGVKGQSEVRCTFCADGVTADQLSQLSQLNSYHRKYEAIAALVLREESQEKLLEKGYTVKEEVGMFNLSFDAIEAQCAVARRDILIAKAAVVKAFESSSTAIFGFMYSKYKPKAPLHMRDYLGLVHWHNHYKLEVLHKLTMPAIYKRSLLPPDEVSTVLSNKAIGICEIDERAHQGYAVDNELCRVVSACQQSKGCITILMKVVPDALPSRDLAGWPTSPHTRLHSALKLLLATMDTAVRDTVIYMYYPLKSKHLDAARKILVPRSDIDVIINPEVSQSATSQTALHSYFT